MKRITQFIDRHRTYQYFDTTTHRWVPGPTGKPVLVRRSSTPTPSPKTIQPAEV